MKQSIWESFRVIISILRLFKDCCFCCEGCSLVLDFLSLSSFFSFEFESFSFSVLRCSSKASCFALISAEVIFARISAAWEDPADIEVLLALSLYELNPLELSYALSSRCALASSLASSTLSSCSSYQSKAVWCSFSGITDTSSSLRSFASMRYSCRFFT